MKKKKLIILTLVCLVMVLMITACQVEDEDDGDDSPVEILYVATDGDNSNDGSSEFPWRTIQQALDRVQSGQTIVVREGTYNEELYFSHSGAQNNPVILQGESAVTTIIDGRQADRDQFFIENSSYITITNLTFRNAPRAGLRLSHSHHINIRQCIFANHGRWGIFTDFSNHTTIENCQVYGSQVEHGIYISNSSDSASIRGNIVHHNYASGIQINADPSMGDDGISTDCLIENNLVYENGRGGGAAINLASVRQSTIRNNMIYNNYAGGIAAWDDGQGSQWGSRDLVILHNTVYFRSDEGRWALSLKNGSSHARVYNNILCGGRRGGFEFTSDCLTGLEIDYNIYYRANSLLVVSNNDQITYALAAWQLQGYDHHSFSAFPQILMVDITNNYRLRNGSSAIDRGINQNVAYDFEGDTRPQGTAPDIGADEYVSGTAKKQRNRK